MVVKALLVFIFTLALLSGCARQVTDNMDPAKAPLQRSIHVNPSSPPSSQDIPSQVTMDWAEKSVAGHPPQAPDDWKKEIKDAAERANKNDPAKLIPDHSYRSIWVHLFPILQVPKAPALWPKRMASPDPYLASKDLGSIKLESLMGFIVAKLKDGTIVSYGQKLSFDLAKNIFILDGKSHPYEDLYVEASSVSVTSVSWDHNKYPYRYRGGFVITKEELPTGAIGLRLVNVVDFETYLMDVVPGEMPAMYHEEALKVQAVAARTYALNKMLEARCEYSRKTRTCRKTKPLPYDVFATTQHQLYFGVAKETDRTNIAVAATAGEVVVHKGQVAFAMFHANSGGQTCSYEDCVGGNSVPYLTSQVEPDQDLLRKIGGGTNRTVVSSTAFANTVKQFGIPFKDSQVLGLEVVSRNSSERVEGVVVKGIKSDAYIPQETFNKIRIRVGISTNFVEDGVLNDKKELVITSYGWGHGVGISQEGARLQAQRKIHYKDIIGFYYQDCSVFDLRKSIPGSM